VVADFGDKIPSLVTLIGDVGFSPVMIVDHSVIVAGVFDDVWFLLTTSVNSGVELHSSAIMLFDAERADFGVERNSVVVVHFIVVTFSAVVIIV